MGRRQISKIILMETIFVGIISLAVGILIGIFASQLMSILVAKMFEADMSDFQFVFSKDACIKTCIYFAIMYVAVMIFNTLTVSRYKLINLLNASKKNEKVKIKNPFLCVIIFILASAILGYAYWKVTGDVKSLTTADKTLPPILMGIVSTVLIFWSLSGFILQVIQTRKKVYLKGTNVFVLRQINSKINTMVVSMSVICLMLFMTISILSSSLALRNTLQRELVEMTPVDFNLYKTANLPESYMKYGKDQIEIPVYASDDLTWKDFLGNQYEETKKEFPMLMYDTAEQIVKVSDYNKVAKLYGIEQYELNKDEYIMLCDFDSMEAVRNKALAEENNDLIIEGK